MGSTFDCADHSKSVCFFERAIISSPVIVFFSVPVAILNLLSTLTEPRKHETHEGGTKNSPGTRRLLFVKSSCSWCLRGLGSLLQHRVALRLELVAGLPVRHLVGLRDTLADGEQHAQVLARAVQIPAWQHDVERRVVPLLVPLLSHLLGVFLRLADEVHAAVRVERGNALLRE